MSVENEIHKDRRAHQRPRFFKEVKIIFNNSKCVYDAYLRNVSAYGAQLDTRMSDYMPSEFAVHFVSDAMTVPAKVIWRSRDAIGVEFKHAA